MGIGRDYTILLLVDGRVFFDREGRLINVAPGKLRGCQLNYS